MSYSGDDVTRFYHYFTSNSIGYGVTQVGQIINDKAQSQSHLVYEKVTPAVLSRHFSGEQSIGLSPLLEDDTVSWCAIDLDNEETITIKEVLNAISEFNFPLVPCYSKSKKLHLYIFFTDSPKAEEAVKLTRLYAQYLLMPKKVEIFPKQTKITKTKFPSWINIPYFDANSENHRKCIHEDKLLDLHSFLDVIESRRKSLLEHKRFLEKEFVYRDIPPCLRRGVIYHDVGSGSRNNWLFSLSVYLKAIRGEGSDVASELLEINNALHDPLSEHEVRSTVLKAIEQNTYYYKCSEMQECDKALCRTTEFGINSTHSTKLDYGPMKQYMTDPPYYTWEINGQIMQFWSEDEILSQSKFRKQCLRYLHYAPISIKDADWMDIVNRSLTNIQVVDVDTEGDFTAGSEFVRLVGRYFNEGFKASNATQVVFGRVYKDEERHMYTFSPSHFVNFLEMKNDFKTYTAAEIRSRLVELGAFRDGKFWSIPIASIPAKEEAEDMHYVKTYEVEDEGF